MNDKVNRKILKASGIFALIFILGILIFGLFEIVVYGMKNNIDYIDAGERWSSDGSRFAVISLYTEDSAAVNADQVKSWAYSMDNALLNSSVTPGENARSWTYCYSAESTMSLVGPKGDASAEVMAVGGDFFVFHQLKFTYGSYFLNDDTNPMGIILDRELAWKLFGAENIVGMTININDYDFTIVGIAERDSYKGTYAYTYGERPRMYMSYAGYSKIYGDKANITAFETAIPNSVKSFAKNIFDSVVKVNSETTAVSEVSDRFSLINRFNNMKTLKYSWIRSNKIEYPYWENEARVSDYICASLMIFEVIFVAISLSSMLISFVLLRISGYTFGATAKNIYAKIKKINKNKKSQINRK